MRSIARIDDHGRHNLRRIGRRTFSLVAHDDGVNSHGFNRQQRIAQTLPLDDAARPRCDIDDISAEVLARQLERGARPRARFIEQCDD